MHLFGHNLDHDYYFELPREGERDTQSHVQEKAEVFSGSRPTGARVRAL
jgi:hypothetical protein